MSRTPDPARHSLYLALGAVGLLPAALAALAVGGLAFSVIGVEPPAVLAGLIGSIALVALIGSVISVPVGLAALGSYRRRTPPSRSRTAWTAVVLALISPLAWVAGVLVWEILFAM